MLLDYYLHDIYDDAGNRLGLYKYTWGDKVLCYLKYRDAWYVGIYIGYRPEDKNTLICTVAASDMPIDFLPEEYVRPLN